VAQLVKAAASVIAEVGYEAATMTAISDRADASIGAVYQYFPNKEAIARALRHSYGNEMEKRWTRLEQETAEMSVRALAHRLVDVMVQFMEEHPAYILLLDIPVAYKRDPAARNRLRRRLAGIFRSRKPELSQEYAYRVSNVSLQIIKSMNELYADANPNERHELVREYRLVLAAYLESRLAS
jgi:AcrR family transcriptional regulator